MNFKIWSLAIGKVQLRYGVPGENDLPEEQVVSCLCGSTPQKQAREFRGHLLSALTKVSNTSVLQSEVLQPIQTRTTDMSYF